ncbi:NAD(P)/FAD-dependent oxidoreductase [Collinsella tanakaei]|uniref:NAD(P)/FAD-dependent oxidoreductase n=1 Tax=Collinsella tanakaei TaxID=626935 RepID=UPI00195898A9|nr:FAD-dependent oxidoreductase [Collinsella tanakaei]MBM6867511.1 FAD-dependent oxidoreductase [Collinsella tanakaei]
MEDEKIYDVAIIGAGPAGASAALYAARSSMSTAIIEQGMPGGQIATTDVIDNYPGLPDVSGPELGQRMLDHAEAAGAEIVYAMVTGLERAENGTFVIQTDGDAIFALSVIVATGAAPRTVGFVGEDTFRGRGVSYCATCDGMFYRGKNVFVVGGGNAACEEGLYLSHIAKSVTMVVRRDEFRAPKGRVDSLLARDNVSVRYSTSIAEVSGEQLISAITFTDNKTGCSVTETFPQGSVGVFVFAGTDPIVELVAPLVDRAPDGGVLTDDGMATRTPGLYCAGDMRSKRLRQVVTAVSDGAIAATSAYSYVEGLR